MGTTLKFYVNTFKKSKRDNRYPIYLRIIHNQRKSEGKICLVPINDSDFGYWNKESQRFSSKKKHLLQHNIFLNELQNEFHDFLRTHITTTEIVNPQKIRDYLLSRNKTEHITVIEAANQFYNKVILTDVDKAPGTKRNYKKSINHLCNFLFYTKQGKLGVKEFKKRHVSKFIEYLKAPIPALKKIGLNGQSVNSIVKNIKPLFKKLYFEESITFNPFEGVIVPFKKTDKPRLSNEKFIIIATLDLSHKKSLEVYRDIFLFLCYTGLSYCDIIDLKQNDVINGRIELLRKKSKVCTKQFLTKQVLILLEKYKNQIPEQRILPKRSLDKVNLNLKILAAMTNIEFSLCTYTARRFFRQSISESGISESLVIKSLMGHTNSNDIDSHYFHVSDDILIKAKKKLQKHFKKLLK